MNERGSGVGSFLLGLGVGAVLGFLLAPEMTDATRAKLTRRLRGWRDLAAEKAGELGDLLVAADEDADEEEEEEAAPRAVLETKLTEAKRRRRSKTGAAGTARLAPGGDVEGEDKPVA
jgi:gas vesicle protein